uniref:Uncharacterized protein n=1 Tax=Megaselia scalaris TaxID=36166 RepID=T1GSP1_MEGSC
KVLWKYGVNITSFKRSNRREKGRLRTESDTNETSITAATLRNMSLEGKPRYCVTRWTPINERLCMFRGKKQILQHQHNLRSFTNRRCKRRNRQRTHLQLTFRRAQSLQHHKRQQYKDLVTTQQNSFPSELDIKKQWLRCLAVPPQGLGYAKASQAPRIA